MNSNSATYNMAVEKLDRDLDRAADEAWTWILENIPEERQHDAMQKVYGALDKARRHGLVAIQLHCAGAPPALH